jgi:hypothetical protein
MLNLVNKFGNNVFYNIKQLSPLNFSRSNKNYLFAFLEMSASAAKKEKDIH